jgi:chemotaxis protein histidine kinase CheA
MANDEVIPYKNISELKQELEGMNEKKVSVKDLHGVVQNLSKTIYDMLEVFAAASYQMKIEEKEQEAALKKHDLMLQKLDKVIEQNKTIAESMVAIVKMVKKSRVKDYADKTTAKEESPALEEEEPQEDFSIDQKQEEEQQNPFASQQQNQNPFAPQQGQSPFASTQANQNPFGAPQQGQNPFGQQQQFEPEQFMEEEHPPSGQRSSMPQPIPSMPSDFGMDMPESPPEMNPHDIPLPEEKPQEKKKGLFGRFKK